MLVIISWQAEAQRKFKHLNKNCIEEFKFCVAYPADFKPEPNVLAANGKKFTNDAGFLIQGSGRLKTKSDTFEGLHKARMQEIGEQFKNTGGISYDTTEKKQMFFIGWETKEKEYLECTFFKGNFIKTIYMECPQGGLESREDLMDVLRYFGYTASRNISKAR